MSFRASRTSLVLCLITSSFTWAQSPDGPYWNTVPKPANLVGSPSARGTLVLMETSTGVHFYSGVHRTWTVLNTSPSPTITSFNAFAIVQDGTNVHGYSSRSGTLASLTVSASAQVYLGPTSSCWVAVVQDGTDVWGYSGFRGTWVHQAIQSSLPRIDATRLEAVVDDGVNLYGFGAYEGTWAVTPGGPNVAVQLGGSIAIANTPTVARAFSPSRNDWTVVPFNGALNITMSSSGSCVFMQDGQTVLAMNGYTGTHELFTIQDPAPQILAGREIGTIVDGNTVIGYAPGPGRSDRITFASAPTVEMNSELFVATDGSDLYAFSGVIGRYATALVGPVLNLETNESAALAQRSSTEYFAYSPILNAWSQSPIVIPTTTLTMRNGAMLVHPGGYLGYASRTGTWSNQPSSSPATFQNSSSWAIFAGLEGNAVHIFDSRLGRWTTQVAGTTPTLSMFRLTAVAYDATQAYGYSLFTNVWDTTPLVGTPTNIRANSSIGFIETTSHLHTYTAVGSLSTQARYAEFSRFEVRGTNLRYLQAGTPGTIVTAIFGTAATELPIPGLGTLFVDPASVVATASMGTIAANGLLDLSIALPTDPSAIGVTIHAQDLLLSGSNAWLTNSISPVIF